MPIPSYEELERELDVTRDRLDKAVKALSGSLSAEQVKRACDIGFQTGIDTAFSAGVHLVTDPEP